MNPISKFIKARIDAARTVSVLTHKSVLYHFFDCLYCNWRYGCRCYQYSEMSFYKLRSFDRERTMTGGHNKKTLQYNDPQYMHFTQNKNEFNQRFEKYIRRDWLYCGNATAEEITAFVNRLTRVIVKPNASEAGIGIFILEASPSLEQQVNEIVGKDLIIEECVVQHPDLVFGGHSVNTIRVITMVDNQGNPHILTAALRCGIGNSVVDNFSAGGVGYPVNIDNGLIEAYGIQVTNMRRPIFIHPGTNIVMIGKKIPYWTEVLKLVEEAARVVPQLRYVGWDVAVTETGPLLIEGNPSPGFGLLEGIGNTRGIYGEIVRYAHS